MNRMTAAIAKAKQQAQKALPISAEEIEQAQELVNKAVLHVKVYHCFFGALVERLKLKVDPRHPTMYTDAVVIGFNPRFVLQLGWNATVFILLHEIMHCALRHPFRRGDRDPKLWNVAIDHVVNLALLHDPDVAAMRPAADSEAGCGLADARFEGYSAEQVYEVLKLEQQQEPEQQQEQQQEDGPSGGSGEAGDCCDAGSSGEPFDEEEEEEEESEEEQSDDDADAEGKGEGEQEIDAEPEEGSGKSKAKGSKQGEGEGEGSGEGEGEQPADEDDGIEDDADIDGSGSEDQLPQTDEQEQQKSKGQSASQDKLDQLEREWGEAVETAALAAGGEMGSSMARALGDAGQAPRMSFEQYVDAFAQRCLADAETWKRANRRFSSIYLPSRSQPSMKKIVAGIDTSASIDAAQLAKFAVNLQRIADDFDASEIIAVFCDTKVRHVERFAKGESIELHPEGGGGTRFGPVFAHARELMDQGEDIAGVVYLTDLEGRVEDWQLYSDIETLWVSTQLAEKSIYGRPPFGEVCHLFDA